MTPRTFIKSDRLFEVWAFTPSHKQLLLRANKEGVHATRIEILFKDVSFMAIPPFGWGLNVEVVGADDSRLPPGMAKVEQGRQVYLFEWGDKVGYVIAGAAIQREDDLDYDAPSELLVAPFVTI